MSAIVPTGVLSVGAVVPGAAGVIASAAVSVQGEFTGLLTAQANFALNPPSLSASITTLTALIANIQLAIAVGVPSVNAEISASFSIQLAALQVQLQLLLELQGMLLTAGVMAYSWEGTGQSFGTDVNTTVAAGWQDGSGPTVPANAIILATTSAAAWTAMQAFFSGAV